MKDFLDFLEAYPAALKVFRSTTAGWMRYGNFGFSWGRANQSFPRSTHFCEKLNQIAYDLLQEYPSIYKLDGYWLTLPRPDNTEATNENKIGKHLVHPGQDVVNVLGRKWFTFIMQHFCSGIIHKTSTSLRKRHQLRH